jgi:hypothetical protein
LPSRPSALRSNTSALKKYSISRPPVERRQYPAGRSQRHRHRKRHHGCRYCQWRTVIRNAASEPHVQELCHFLNTLGARIENIGSNTLHIQGVPRLHGGEFTIGPDYLEVVSFIGAAVVTNSSIRIQNAGQRNTWT